MPANAITVSSWPRPKQPKPETAHLHGIGCQPARRIAAAASSVVTVMTEEDSSEYGFARVRVVGAESELLD
jgi:hypothetical protein